LIGSKAAGADIELFLLAFYHQSGCMDVDLPASVGMALGMAYIMPVLRRFPAKVTFGSQVIPL
jgi:hypothetical protein